MMKKTLKTLLVSSVLALILMVAVSAETVKYELKEYDASKNEYDLVINVALEGTEKATTFATTIELNNKVIAPVSTESGYITTASVTVAEGRNNVTYSFILLDSKWTVTGDKTELLVSCTSKDFDKFDNASLDILTIPLKLAEGVKPEDVTEADFKITKAYLATSTGNKFGLNEPSISTPFNNLKNNVIPAKTAPDTLNDGVKNVTDGSGVRYKTTFAKALKNTVSEYGFVVTTAANLTTSELNMALVSDGKAVKGVAYGTDKDIYWSADDTESLVTAVIVGVPMTKTDLQTKIAVRSYYILKDSGTVVYGKVVQNSVYEIAKSVKKAGGTAYESNKTYIDAVIAAVDGTQTTAEVQLDVDPLFSIEA